MSTRLLSLFSSDSELFNALRRRDEKAYHFLYTECLPSFQHWVLNNSGSAMDAEDAFQKGMLSFLLNVETGKYQLQENARITTVVFDYCKRVWLTELKSARFRTRATMPETINAVDTSDVAKDLERLEVIDAVQESLKLLKEECRKLIEWFYVEELSLREIAERLGMKESSVKSKRYDCAEKWKLFYQKTAKQKGI